MATKKQKTNKEVESEVDPFDELNEYEEDLTIETEKDFFDELEQANLENVPEYDSESGKIIEKSETDSQTPVTTNEVVKEKKSSKTVVDKVKKINESLEKTEIKKSDVKDKLNIPKVSLSKPKSSMPKPNKQAKKLSSDKKIKDDTKIIDNVKVDSDGVPLLNQFDTEKIKDSSFFPTVTVSKISLSKIVMIVVGLIITIIGIYQAMNDVVRVSDHVMYGEHESLAFGLIFLGIIIIILAFYKEIMKMAGLNNLTNVMDDIESSSKPEPKEKESDKK